MHLCADKRRSRNFVFARDAERAKVLKSEFSVSWSTYRPPVADGRKPIDFSHFDILVNATPLGNKRRLWKTKSIAAAEQLKDVRLVYDLIYNPAETRLIREAKAAGAETLGGLEMLIAQGARAICDLDRRASTGRRNERGRKEASRQ